MSRLKSAVSAARGSVHGAARTTQPAATWKVASALYHLDRVYQHEPDKLCRCMCTGELEEEVEKERAFTREVETG